MGYTGDGSSLPQADLREFKASLIRDSQGYVKRAYHFTNGEKVRSVCLEARKMAQ